MPSDLLCAYRSNPVTINQSPLGPPQMTRAPRLPSGPGPVYTTSSKNRSQLEEVTRGGGGGRGRGFVIDSSCSAKCVLVVSLTCTGVSCALGSYIRISLSLLTEASRLPSKLHPRENTCDKRKHRFQPLHPGTAKSFPITHDLGCQILKASLEFHIHKNSTFIKIIFPPRPSKSTFI